MDGRKRKAKFSVYETDVMVDEVYRHRTTLFHKPYTQASNEKKLDVWKAITKRVNEVCTVRPRTMEEVRKKWYYYWYAKKKETSRRTEPEKTGTAEELYTPTELKMLEMFNEFDTLEGGKGSWNDDEGNVNDVKPIKLDINYDRKKSTQSQRKASNQTHDSHSSFSDDEGPTCPPHPSIVHTETVVKDEPEMSVITVSASDTSPLLEWEALRRPEPPLKLMTFAQPPSPPMLCESPSKQDPPRYRDPSRARDRELVKLQRRRVALQEQQLKVLQDIHKQMQQDSERQQAFQQELLAIHKQRLELARRGASED